MKSVAEKYGLPEGELADALMLAGAILGLDKPSTTREKLREIKRQRKLPASERKPDYRPTPHNYLGGESGSYEPLTDEALWAEEFNLKAKQQRVAYHAETGEITVEKNDALKKNSSQSDHRIDAAVLHLRSLWLRHHKHASKYAGNDDWGYGSGDFLQYLADSLKLLNLATTPAALKQRLFRLDLSSRRS